MAPTTTKKSAVTAAAGKTTVTKKEKIFHPNSRKADQLNRKETRRCKLAEQAVNRTKKQASIGARSCATFTPSRLY
jgi:translation machinery-associated protein 16